MEVKLEEHTLELIYRWRHLIQLVAGRSRRWVAESSRWNSRLSRPLKRLRLKGVKKVVS